jgi:crotonobetainyl-CoA:carnitine CoA-transferase CaiB-like acyl-CoA transferase
MIQGLGGLMNITGSPDGVPGGGPIKVGVAVADLFTGLYASVAVLGALVHRMRTGEGQHIDLALLDCQVAMLANQALNYLVSGAAPGRLGNAHPNIVPYQTFAAADGHLILAVGNDGQFRRFCDLAGRPELAQDPRFATNPARVAHREQLVAILAEVFKTRPRQDWLKALEAAGVPAGPINDIAEVFADPQVRHRALRRDTPHGQLGQAPGVACPIRYSATPLACEEGPPALGEHTGAVLQGLLGLSCQRLAELRAAGIVGGGEERP